MSTFILDTDWDKISLLHWCDSFQHCWCNPHYLTIAYPISGMVRMEIHRTYDSSSEGDLFPDDIFLNLKRFSLNKKP